MIYTFLIYFFHEQLIQNNIDPEIILRKKIINIKEKIEIKEKIKKLNFEEFEKEEIKQILFDN